MSEDISLINITDGNHLDRVIEENDFVILDLWAPWCGPCKMQAPIFSKVADQAGEITETSGVQFVKVNVDDVPEAAARYGVRSIPTLIIVKKKDVLHTLVGLQQEQTLLNTLQEVVACHSGTSTSE